MHLLPYLTETEDTKYWNPAQIWSFALLTYLLVGCFVTTLGIAFLNLTQFVIRDGKCQSEHPLLIFYILAITCLFLENVSVLLLVEVDRVG